MLINRFLKLITAMTLLMVGTATHAGLLNGESVEVKYLFPSTATTYQNLGTTVVGDGVEYTQFPYFDLDISDNAMVFDFKMAAKLGTTNFNGIVLRDINNTVTFTSVTLDAISNMVGLNSSRIFFDAHSIYVNFSALSFNANTLVKLNLGGISARVPESSSLILLLVGLLGLMMIRWRKRV